MGGCFDRSVEEGIVRPAWIVSCGSNGLFRIIGTINRLRDLRLPGSGSLCRSSRHPMRGSRPPRPPLRVVRRCRVCRGHSPGASNHDMQWFSSANFMDRLSNSGERIAPVQTVLTWMSLHERVGSEQLNSSASSMATYLLISTEPTFLPLAMIFRTETTPIPVVPLVIKVVLLFYDSYWVVIISIILRHPFYILYFETFLLLDF